MYQVILRPDNIVFVIDGISVILERHGNLLEVHIDDCLTFEYHIEHILSKAARQLNVLKRMSDILVFDSNLIFKSFDLFNWNTVPLFGIFWIHFT